MSWSIIPLAFAGFIFYNYNSLHSKMGLNKEADVLKASFVQDPSRELRSPPTSSAESQFGELRGPLSGTQVDNFNPPTAKATTNKTLEREISSIVKNAHRSFRSSPKRDLKHPLPKKTPASAASGVLVGSNKTLSEAQSEVLWNIALGAAVPRGEVNGRPRLSAFVSKRVGKSRHDGKAWQAGEEGCPEKPKFSPLPGGALSQGDSRLKRFHFVHPPKSGGTTFGLVVVAAACEVNKQFRSSLDCCVKPADWCAENCSPEPDCKAIYGCTLCDCHHIPRMHRLHDATWSVTIIRHPMTRYISGYFYRAHSPNWDRFNIRPGYFLKDPTYPFRFSFDDYLGMPEYHNILIKMFARDAFPYFNATLTEADYQLSRQRLSHFLVVGINEAYDASVQLLLSLTGVELRDDQIHLPYAMTSTYSKDHEEFKSQLRRDPVLTKRIRTANEMDVRLFEWGVAVFCEKLCARNLQVFDKRGVCGS